MLFARCARSFSMFVNVALGAISLSLFPGVTPASAQGNPYLPPAPATISTIPKLGDMNPYGTAFVPLGYMNRNNFAVPQLHRGDLLVSNFNGASNLQGTGRTIVRFDAHGVRSLFYHAAANEGGLTGALQVFSDGIVAVGNMQTVDGTSATVQAGGIQFVSPAGKILNVLTDPAISGPWGMAISEHTGFRYIWVSNVLTGTIARLQVNHPVPTGPIHLINITTIASGLAHTPDPAALELGPSGLLYDPATDTLYFANSLQNAVYKLAHASTAGPNEAIPMLVFQDTQHLHGPLDLSFAPNGNLLVANSDGSNVNNNDPSEISEYTPGGKFVTQFSVDPTAGGAFGIAVQTSGLMSRFAAVDDVQNTVTIFSQVMP